MRDMMIRKSWILGILCCFAFATSAIGAEYVIPTQETNPRISDQKHNQMKMKYRKDRMDYLLKVADLTTEEGEWLDAELIRYDDKRAELWKEMRDKRKSLEKNDQAISDGQYTEYLRFQIEHNNKMNDVQNEFITILTDKLPPKKAFQILEGIRSHGRRTSRSLMQE